MQKIILLTMLGLILQTTLAENSESETDVVNPVAPCNTICPFIFAPVCAFNGVEYIQFSNKCQLSVVQCNAKVEGKFVAVLKALSDCSDDVETNDAHSRKKYIRECPSICPALFKPVCASQEGKFVTFSNNCVLGIAICKARRDGTPIPMSVVMEKCEDWA